MVSYAGTNYYSIVFRKALSPEYEIGEKRLAATFFLSKTFCKICYREDGTKTFVGQFFAFPRRVVSFLRRIFKRLDKKC